MKDVELLRKLQKEGWQVKSIRGSHHKLIKDEKTITLAVHRKELKKGMLEAILKQAGME